ncbi:MAG: ABC transporter substrate-binding protein, partial [Verrucomicrobia bacterium]|nr:ABC transporter substrate-binding protein [Verrucomicrobiota bacterium]
MIRLMTRILGSSMVKTSVIVCLLFGHVRAEAEKLKVVTTTTMIYDAVK